METSLITYTGIGAVALGVLVWRLSGHAITHGSAKWLALWDASAEQLFRRRGLLLGDWTGVLPVHAGQDGHVLTVAPTGRGKGTCAIIPNLLRQRFIVLVDPGGENTAVAIKSWRAKKFDVQVLNPWSMHAEAPWALPCHRFNPVSILAPKSPRFASDASLIAEMLIGRGPKDTSNTSYFKAEAQSGLRAMLMHMVTTEAPERCHLATLRDWIMLDGKDWDALIAAMTRNRAARGVIAREAQQLLRRKEQAPEEFSAIVSTMKQDTNFLDDPVMREALSGSDADFSALKGYRDGKLLKGAVISVVIPLEYVKTHAAYARLAIAVALWELQRAPLARERVLFVLDEFPALGRMDRIASGLAELRKYKVWLWPIIQDLSQLKTLYGESWSTFLSNAVVKQWFGTGDLETAKYISESCGDATVFAKGGGGMPVAIKRRLVTPEEVQRLKLNRQIVMVGNLRAMSIRLTPYWERPEFSGRFHRNPYTDPSPRLSSLTAAKVLWGRFVSLAAKVLEPAPSLIYAAALALVFTLRPAIIEGEYAHANNRTLVICAYRGVLGREYRVIDRTWGRKSHCRLIKIREVFLP